VAKRRVLITGASGYVAAQMLPTLRERFDCTLVDTRETDRHGATVEGIRHADLTQGDLDAHRAHFQGIDTVVHLAYIHPPAGQAGRGPQTYYTERTNVDMAFHVYQLSLEEGVRRVVTASSNHAADWYEGLVHARKKDVVDPWERAVSDNFYGWAKEAYEHLGFVFASGRMGRQLEGVQVRIGAPREIVAARFETNPVGYNRDLGAYISPRDLTQLFVRSIETEDIRDAHGIPFQIFYGISDNTRKFWSITNARRVIGYAPEDDSEVKYADDIRRLLVGLGTPVPARDFNPGPGTG
jgi:NAD(P)-dependent dehydrogenase (short-subunit alcohol dehydrogenase family)